MAEKKPCPPGKERNPDTGRCRKIKTAKAPKGSKQKKPCPPGKERNPETGRCRKIRLDRPAPGELESKWDKKIPIGVTPAGNVRYTTPKKVATDVAVQAATKYSTEKVEEWRKSYVADPKGTLARTREYVGGVAKWAIPVAVILAATQIADERLARGITFFTNAQLDRVQRTLGRNLSEAEAQALIKQYADYVAQKWREATISLDTKDQSKLAARASALMWLKQYANL